MKIDLSVFKQKYDNVKNAPSNEIITEKVNNLLKKYSCFNSIYDPKMIWEKKKYNKKENKQNKNRFHIIIPDFTDNSILKRQLTGHLNKLSSKNKTVIYEKINEIIISNNTEEYFQLIWSYIKTDDNDLYFDILNFFEEEFLSKMINKMWDNYIENKEWYPSDYIITNNILLLNDEYDMYCNYVKWKKEINIINSTWIKLNKNMDLLLNDILDTMIKYMNNKLQNEIVYKHVIDIFLEQIYKITKHYNCPNVVKKVKDMDIKLFDNSSRFLIYNIIEKK
jgi:hypothetical protein